MSPTRRSFLLAPGALAALPLSQLQLGVTNDEIADDPAAAVRFLKEFGLRWAEIRNVWGKYNTAQPLEKMRELRSLFDEHGISTSVLATGFFKVPVPRTDRALDEQWALLDAGLERAKIMGTSTLRTFAFTYRPNEKDEAVYGRIYELLREAARRAKAHGCRLAVENVGQSYVWSSSECAAMLKAVREDNLGLTWDPNNAAQMGDRVFPEGYRRLDPGRIFNIHLRDFRKSAAGPVEWCAVGEGEMDNLGQIRAARRDGYRGPFTLETHYKSPLGKEHASRTSLGALLKVVERV